jgi:hypothetical protein
MQLKDQYKDGNNMIGMMSQKEGRIREETK